MFPVVLSNL